MNELSTTEKFLHKCILLHIKSNTFLKLRVLSQRIWQRFSIYLSSDLNLIREEGEKCLMLTYE